MPPVTLVPNKDAQSFLFEIGFMANLFCNVSTPDNCLVLIGDETFHNVFLQLFQKTWHHQRERNWVGSL